MTTFNPAILLIPIVGAAAVLLMRRKAHAAPAPAPAGSPMPGPMGVPATPTWSPTLPGLGIPSLPQPALPQPSAPAIPTTHGVPRNWQGEVAAAVSAGDTARMRHLAAEMLAIGKVNEAALLRNYAQLLDQSRVSRDVVLNEVNRVLGPGATRSPGVPQPTASPTATPTPAASVPAVSAAPVPTAAVPTAATPVAAPTAPTLPSPFPGGPNPHLAQRTAEHLRTHKRYKEDRTLVRLFQQTEGLKNDGLYGVMTALALAKYGIVPPKPFYYSRTKAAQQKRDYAAALAQYALRDPTRSTQWLEASRVQRM